MAGRPRKTEFESTEKAVSGGVDETKTLPSDTALFDELKKENAELKEQMASILSLLKEKDNKKSELPDNVGYDMNRYEFAEINPLQQIRVVSLSDGGVTLCTERFGKGKSFRFDKFGHFRPIAYSDLQDIISANRDLIESGVVYICDKDVIKNNYLTECYQKFLDVMAIENILTFDEDTIRSMITNTTVPIQETVISIVVDKIVKGEYVDMNKVRIIGESCATPCDIHTLALQKKTK